MSEITTALIQFAVSSVGMMVGNKMAVGHMQSLPTTLVLIQVIGTLLLLGVYNSQVKGMKLGIALRWIPVAILFTAMIFTSMKSFVYVNVSTVIIFRNIGSIATTVVEYFARGVTVNTPIILSEVAIVGGAWLYGESQGATFNWMGFYWILANVGTQVTYGVLLRVYMDQARFKDMSKYTMSLYNNFLAIPFLMVIFFLQEENLRFADDIQKVTPIGWGLVVVTCGLGFLISTSGFGLQKLVSATTFLVINNLSKFMNILIGVAVMGDKLNGPKAYAGCVLAIVSGAAYSYFTMQLNAAKKAADSKDKKK